MAKFRLKGGAFEQEHEFAVGFGLDLGDGCSGGFCGGDYAPVIDDWRQRMGGLFQEFRVGEDVVGEWLNFLAEAEFGLKIA